MDLSDVPGFIVAVVVIVGAGAIALRWQEMARRLHKYYNSAPKSDWGPAWTRWQFKPTLQQTTIMTWLGILIFGVLGIAFLLMSLGLLDGQ